MKEIWKGIDGFPKYQVSNLGRVRRRDSGRILKRISRSSGFYFVNLHSYKPSVKYVHSLVAEAFLGKKPEGCITIHKNSKLDDNRACNLKYGSHKDLHQIYFKMRGKSTGSKLSSNQVFNIKRRLCKSENPEEIAKKYNVKTYTILDIKYDRSWERVTWPKLKKSFYRKPSRKGEQASNTKLCEDDVLYIRNQLARGVQGILLAKKFNVDAGLISKIKHRKSWVHI